MKLFTGKTIEEAIANGLKELKVDKDKVKIDILDEGNQGFFGFNAREAQVQIRLKTEKELQKEEEAKKREKLYWIIGPSIILLLLIITTFLYPSSSSNDKQDSLSSTETTSSISSSSSSSSSSTSSSLGLNSSSTDFSESSSLTSSTSTSVPATPAPSVKFYVVDFKDYSLYYMIDEINHIVKFRTSDDPSVSESIYTGDMDSRIVFNLDGLRMTAHNHYVGNVSTAIFTDANGTQNKARLTTTISSSYFNP